MERDSKEWLVPLTGIGFVVLVIASFLIAGEPPSADDDVSEIVEHYVDNKDAIFIGSFLGGIGGMLLVFFFGYMRKLLHAAEGEGGMLSLVAFAGAVILAIAIAIDATISIAIAEAAEDIEPASVQTLQALWDQDFVPFAVGAQVLWLATGISIVRHGVLPKWLGWVAIVLGVASLTPAGFFAFFVGMVWIIVVSVMLSQRARGAAQPAAPSPPTP
jgi:hypothetical protein